MAILAFMRSVNDDQGNVWQWYPSISVDGGGNFVIAWEDERNGDYDYDI